MDTTKVTTNALKSVGISAGVLTVVAIIATAAFVYRNYLEIQSLKLQITVLKADPANKITQT